MNKIFGKMNEKKGFTLAELLIVVAIIAVLVAIAIPVFTTQLEKSREATDVANIRSAYATLVADYLNNNASKTVTFSHKATKTGWQTTPAPKLKTMIDGVNKDITIPDTSGGNITVKIDSNGEVTVSAP